jgi:hypothetical protein
VSRRFGNAEGHSRLRTNDAADGPHERSAQLGLGAAGWPQIVPEHVSLWDCLLQFRREFDQYVNLRPVRLMPGVRSPPASLAISISSSCAKTPKANIHRSVGASPLAPSAKQRSRKR